MSTSSSLPEVWMRGPVAEVPDLLQPVAHAILQAREEVGRTMEGFPDELLWLKPAGVASPGFHLQHLTGVLDRLFTYARGALLSGEQLDALSQEGHSAKNGSELVRQFDEQVDRAIAQLKDTSAESLTQFRGVGRKQLPSTVLGLLFHGAEHTQRHVGQLLVTVAILRAGGAGL